MLSVLEQCQWNHPLPINGKQSQHDKLSVIYERLLSMWASNKLVSQANMFTHITACRCRARHTNAVINTDGKEKVVEHSKHIYYSILYMSAF